MSIFSDYKTFRYIYPPRPEAAINPEFLSNIDHGWIAQPKYNGSCAVVFIDGQRSYKIYNRNASELSLQKSLSYTELNDSDKYMVLCGEYLNKSKLGEDGTYFNHKFIIWDILVWQGRYLIGETVESRINVLHKLFGANRSSVTKNGISIFNHLLVTGVENIFMVPSYLGGFKDLYDEISKTDLYEGLVLKKATAKLEPGFKERNNTSWQVKARKQTKNYSF